MDSAIRVFSREGFCKKQIKARDIKSRDNARKLSPFVSSEDSTLMMSWVRPSFDGKKCTRVSHFRAHSRRSVTGENGFALNYDDEEAERVSKINESPEHLKAKTLLSLELKERLAANTELRWSFNDSDSTDLPLIGNLLLGAVEITVEHSFKTSLNNQFRLDIAILGESISGRGKRPIFAAIEIEREHSFNARKEILCKSAGFPLISIDISDLNIEDINSQWAKQVLSETTKQNDAGKRSNYFYVHDVLYPLYARFPARLVNYEPQHQYIVFDNASNLDQMKKWLRELFEIMSISGSEASVLIHNNLNNKNDQERLKIENAGKIVGSGWQEINMNQALLLTLTRPSYGDLNKTKLYMAVARILLKSPTALIGYKYEKGIKNEDATEDIWKYTYYDREKNCQQSIRILPKRLSEPLKGIIDFIDQLRQV